MVIDLSGVSVVGIDLGTTNTVVACVRSGKVHVLADEHGLRLLPSVVSFHPNGEVLVGRGREGAPRHRPAQHGLQPQATHRSLVGQPRDRPGEVAVRVRAQGRARPGSAHPRARSGLHAPGDQRLRAQAHAADRRDGARRAGRARRHHGARALQRAPARVDEGRRSRVRSRGAPHPQRADRCRARLRPRSHRQRARRRLRLRRRHVRLHAARSERKRLRGPRDRRRLVPRRRRRRQPHRRAHGGDLPQGSPLRPAHRPADARAAQDDRRGHQDGALDRRDAHGRAQGVRTRRRRLGDQLHVHDDAPRSRSHDHAARRSLVQGHAGRARARAPLAHVVRQGHPRRRLDAHPAHPQARRGVLRRASSRSREPGRGRRDRRRHPGRRAHRGNAQAQHPRAAGRHRQQAAHAARAPERGEHPDRHPRAERHFRRARRRVRQPAAELRLPSRIEPAAADARVRSAPPASLGASGATGARTPNAMQAAVRARSRTPASRLRTAADAAHGPQQASRRRPGHARRGSVDRVVPRSLRAGTVRVVPVGTAFVGRAGVRAPARAEARSGASAATRSPRPASSRAR